ncbi:MAG: pantetheine-phosphate adenylyltransferase [Defluviitaleaceae bacterium]|nr:pantetheine-phosphate adenylyltransferase [Defluviitaleaceae bacterium]
MTAICPGSFDPVTNGHIDIIRRTLCFADRVIVAVCVNVYKNGLFTPEQRTRLLRQALCEAGIGSAGTGSSIEVRLFSGLLADFFRECGADVVVRGIRSTAEYEHDISQSHANRLLNPRLETLYLPSDPAHVFLSSSIVKEVAAFGGDIRGMVPSCVAAALKEQI